MKKYIFGSIILICSNFTELLSQPKAIISSNYSVINESLVKEMFLIKVEYSEKMDTTVEPVIKFENGLPKSLAYTGGSFKNDSTYVFTYIILDGDENERNIDVTVTKAESSLTPKLKQATAEKRDLFSITNGSPAVQILVSNSTIERNDVGSTFLVTLTFDRSMDVGERPEIFFDGGTPKSLESKSSEFSTTNIPNDTYEFNFEVIEADEESQFIDVTIRGGRDVSGNVHEETTKKDILNIKKSIDIEKLSYDPEKLNFLLSVGYDFDLIDGVQNGSVYTDFNVSTANIWKPDSRWSIDAGIVRSKYAPSYDSADVKYAIPIGDESTTQFLNKSYIAYASQKSEFGNIYLRLRFRLTKNRDNNPEPIKWFVHFQYDFFRRNYENELKFVFQSDSITTTPLPFSDVVESAPVDDINKISTDEYIFSIGSSIYKESKNMDFAVIWNAIGSREVRDKFVRHWSVNAFVLDKTFLGAKIGVIFRDDYDLNFDDKDLKNDNAEYFVYISKIISVSSLFNSVKSLTSIR